ncbi:MAG: RluA family pseudouridine synthase [Anaerovoracaceae bacterium]
MTEEQVYELTIGEEMAAMRIDRVLAVLLEDTSRSFIQKLIADGRLTVNGTPCLSKKQKTAAGDRIVLTMPPPRPMTVEAQEIPLDIVYEDEEVLVVNKPRGMVVHPGVGNADGTLVNALLYHCGEHLSAINGVLRPGIVHRIDKDTSGLLMVAKTERAHHSLAAQLAEHSSRRLYEAVVYNNFRDDTGTIDRPLGRDPRNRLRQAVTDAQHGRAAVTHYRVRERFGRYTLIEARLETGRTHQIRVHMSSIGHPLVGDSLYGPAKNPFGVEGQLLHAGLLGFRHPVSGDYMEFTVPPPAVFRDVLIRLRRQKKGS